MKFDFKNVLIGVILGVVSTVIVLSLLSEVHIDVRIGDSEHISNKTEN